MDRGLFVYPKAFTVPQAAQEMLAGPGLSKLFEKLANAGRENA